MRILWTRRSGKPTGAFFLWVSGGQAFGPIFPDNHFSRLGSPVAQVGRDCRFRMYVPTGRSLFCHGVASTNGRLGWDLPQPNEQSIMPPSIRPQCVLLVTALLLCIPSYGSAASLLYEAETQPQQTAQPVDTYITDAPVLQQETSLDVRDTPIRGAPDDHPAVYSSPVV